MSSKLCIDCKHYGHVDHDTPTSWSQGKAICKHPTFAYLSDPWEPQYRRKRGQSCGPTGKLFEQRKGDPE